MNDGVQVDTMMIPLSLTALTYSSNPEEMCTPAVLDPQRAAIQKMTDDWLAVFLSRVEMIHYPF